MKPLPCLYLLQLITLAGISASAACADSQEISAPEPTVTQRVNYVAITAGYFFSCGLTDVGDVYCWGSLRPGLGGSRPARLESELEFESITAGGLHACGLTVSGQAFCWGRGEFGDGSFESSETPVPAASSLRFASLDAGGFHTCGVTMDNSAYCWGNNQSGQLGGVPASQGTPVVVSGSLTFRQVSAGKSHTCGLSTQSTIYCWGNGRSGEIGDGAGEDRLVPTRVTSIDALESITASQGDDFGDGFTCAVTIGGLVTYCWGQNRWGQTGQIPVEQQSVCNQSTPCDAPILLPEAVLAGPSFSSIALGSEHSCGLTNHGRAWCWGLPVLGDGVARQGPQHDPVQVAGDLVFVSIAAGELHSCGVTTAGDVYCWGANILGALGIDDLSSLVPVRVQDPLVR